MKSIIVINGKGGCGKDALCEAAAQSFKVLNVSSITPVKEAAMKIGWDGQKDEKGRRLLSDIKDAMARYNDLPTKYLADQAIYFIQGDYDIMFAHIRECLEIDKFKRVVVPLRTPVKTLLVRRFDLDGRIYGNSSDDDVEKYQYDWVFENNGRLADLPMAWAEFYNGRARE